jgi:hypothetical protein
MALLDAALAFALTLAALATVVTIIMEIGIRVVGLRKKDQVTLIKRLYDDYLAPTIGITTADADKRWKVVRKILEIPLAGTTMAPSEEEQKFAGTRCSPIYDTISVEHLLRRVVELEDVEKLREMTEKELKAQLSAIAQKYDEYASAIATSFKCRAQFWSLITGIALAIVLNVDGVRLFETYLDNPERTAQVIAQMDPILDEVEKAQARLTAAEKVQLGEGELEDLDKAVKAMEAQLALVGGLELPIGRLFYPHCLILTEQAEQQRIADPLCKSPYAPLESMTWLIKVVVTGLLIGLGAPFWYDVAKRLAEVRQAFGGKGSALQRHSGSDGAGKKDEDRDAMIARVARELRG